MARMSKATRLKLIVPIAYAVLSLLYFVIAWPAQPKIYHLVGILITSVSYILWIFSRIQLGNAFSIAPKSKYLVTSGMYSKLRHPVYYFSITAVLGLVLFAWQLIRVVPLLALIALEVFRIKKEEALLLGSCGNEYAAYKTQTWF